MRSLRRQLTGGLLIVFALLLGGGGAFAYWLAKESLYAQFDSALRLKALVVVTDTQISAGRVRVYFSDRFLREFDKTLATDFFQVFDQSGATVAKSDSLGTNKLPGKLRGTTEAPVYWNLTLPNGDKGRAIGIAFRPRVRSGEETQEVTVVVAASRRGLIDTTLMLRNVLIGCGAALLVLTTLAVWWVTRRGLRPLDDLATSVGQIDAGSLSRRMPVEPLPRELRPVTEKLNELLARLEASFERERRFSSDLAHELRTPLAELRSEAELALKWPEQRNAATDRAVLEIAVQMEALVARLLALSRAENGQQPIELTQLTLAAVIDRILGPLGPKFSDAGLSIERAGDELTVSTDPVLFESIISNLLDNAASYSVRDSAVRIVATATPAGFEIAVHSVPRDLAPEDVPKMFDRFWRKDRARTGATHAGLGLSLSRSFASLLALQLTAELTPEGVLVMKLAGVA